MPEARDASRGLNLSEHMLFREVRVQRLKIAERHVAVGCPITRILYSSSFSSGCATFPSGQSPLTARGQPIPTQTSAVWGKSASPEADDEKSFSREVAERRQCERPYDLCWTKGTQVTGHMRIDAPAATVRARTGQGGKLLGLDVAPKITMIAKAELSTINH